MHINIVLPKFNLSGGCRIACSHAKYLREFGHHVTITAPEEAKLGLLRRLRRSVRQGRYIPERPSQAMDYAAQSGADINLIERKVAPESSDFPDADIIMATWWETVEWVHAAAPSKGAKCHLVQDHEIFPGQPLARVRAAYGSPIYKIAVSGWLAREMRQVYGAYNCALVPNGIDLKAFQSMPRRKGQVPCFGFLYTWAKRKNIALAIEALSQARLEGAEFKAVAFGSVTPIKDLPLPGWIDYHRRPSPEDLRSIYSNCDAWLFTSYSEGFGLPILEAMACHTPVIAAPSGAAPDLINGHNGILTKPSVRSFVREIKRFCRMDNSEWEAMSEAAYRTAQRHDLRHSSEKMEKALEDCLAKDLQHEQTLVTPV